MTVSVRASGKAAAAGATTPRLSANAIPANRLRDMSAKEGSVAMLERILSRGLDQLLKEHQAFWHAYYQQSFLSIPDMKWEGFYWIQVGPTRRCDP